MVLNHLHGSRHWLRFGALVVFSLFFLAVGSRRRNLSMKNRTQQGDPSDRREIDVEVARLAQEKELKEKELNLQRDQLRWNRWGNPAFVAIAADLIGYVSTLYSSYSTRQLEADRQRNTERLEQENHESTLTLEREKQEATLILEAIKT